VNLEISVKSPQAGDVTLSGSMTTQKTEVDVSIPTKGMEEFHL